MNILVINGSPKGQKSNTLRLTRAFLNGICEKVNADIEILQINNMNIKDCLGCFYCWKDEPGKCCIKDDMNYIIKKILASDIIILSFPLYYFSLPSKIKAFIDRQLPMSLPFMSDENIGGSHQSRYDMSNKRYVIISTCGFHTTKNNYDSVDAQFERIYGKDGYEKIYCSQGELFRVPQLRDRTDEYLKNIKRAGTEFVSGKISKETRKLIETPIYPKEVFEEMANLSWGIEYCKEKNQNKKLDESLVLTKQMALLYNKNSWNTKDKVLEMYYTDIDKRYQIIMKKDTHEVIDKDFVEFTTKIETPFEVWKKISANELDAKEAMLNHMYRIKGDFELMTRWNEYFGYESSNSSYKTEEKPTNMAMMLFPWIIIWIFLSIDSKLGANIGIIACSALFLLFIKYRATIFEYISIFLVTTICLLSLNDFSVNILLPISYLSFGLMWLFTVFQKNPLTSYYSMNDFGGSEALKNPLFIRTNKIITLYWAILYMLTPIWTYYLLSSKYAGIISIINSILPILLVLFTNWFSKWYPGYYARK